MKMLRKWIEELQGQLRTKQLVIDSMERRVAAVIGQARDWKARTRILADQRTHFRKLYVEASGELDALRQERATERTQPMHEEGLPRYQVRHLAHPEHTATLVGYGVWDRHQGEKGGFSHKWFGVEGDTGHDYGQACSSLDVAHQNAVAVAVRLSQERSERLAMDQRAAREARNRGGQ